MGGCSPRLHASLHRGEVATAAADDRKVRLVPLSRAVGFMLARDVQHADPGQMPLLRAGARISERYAAALADVGVPAVWVHDELSQDVEPVDLVPPQVRQEAAQEVSNALIDAREAIAAHQPLPPAAMAELQAVVERIVASVASHPGTALVLSDLATADAYTHQHCIDVCALGIRLAHELFSREGWRDDRGRRRGDGVERRLHHLGLGLLVHDVGELAVQLASLNKT